MYAVFALNSLMATYNIKKMLSVSVGNACKESLRKMFCLKAMFLLKQVNIIFLRFNVYMIVIHIEKLICSVKNSEKTVDL